MTVSRRLPKLSIITPSFNQGRFIEETICSVLDQNYPNLEYIIIDGGSADQSLEIIERYSRHLAYYVSEPDRGQSHALNKGLHRATGDIIGWINSDDTYTEGTFAKVVNAFADVPTAGVVHGDRLLIDKKSRVCGWTRLPQFAPERYGYTVCSETAFWRREIAQGEGFREDLRFAMDLEFFGRLYRRTRFIKINDFLGCFRCYPQNKSSTIGAVGLRETAQVWPALFSNHPETWKIVPPVSRVAHTLRLLTHPVTLGIPYLRWKLSLGRTE